MKPTLGSMATDWQARFERLERDHRALAQRTAALYTERDEARGLVLSFVDCIVVRDPTGRIIGIPVTAAGPSIDALVGCVVGRTEAGIVGTEVEPCGWVVEMGPGKFNDVIDEEPSPGAFRVWRAVEPG